MNQRLVDREWHWLDDGVLPYSLCAMRALWIWLLLHFASRALTPTRGDWIALPTIFGLLAVSTWLAHLGIFRIKKDMLARLLIALGGLVAIVSTIYLAIGITHAPIWDWRWLLASREDLAGSVPVLLVTTWLWRWGILTGRTRLLYDVFSFNFTVGTLVFSVVFGAAFGTNIVSTYELALPLLTFFAIGLGSLALSSLQDARRFEGKRTGQQIGVNGYWLATIGAIIGILLVGGLVLTLLFVPESLAGVLALLAFIFDLVMRLLYWMILIVSFIIFGVLEFFASFFPPLQQTAKQQNPELPSGLDEELRNLQHQTPAQLPPELHLLLEIAAVVLILGAILLVFAFAFRRFRYLEEEETEETRETIFSLDLLKAQLADFFGPHGAKRAPTVAPFLALDEDDPRSQIRRTYQALLAWAGRRGVPRPPGMTPNEFLGLLNRLLPAASDSFATINSLYVQARYSPASISSDNARAAASAWEQITHVEA
jgi:hypothetical protein